MTSGSYTAAPPTPAVTPAPTRASRQTSHTPSAMTENAATRSMGSNMAPPVEPASRCDRSSRLRNSGSRPSSSIAPPQTTEQDSESLFIPHGKNQRQDDEELAWEPMDYEREETLGWDASANHDASVFPTFRDSGRMPATGAVDDNETFEPTQRVSQIKGLW